MEKLNQIQQALKIHKSQHNSFGGYNYRSCEDILEAVKPHLDGCILTLNDEIIEVAGRVYVKATAKIDYKGSFVETKAYAREPQSKKGMDESQITGAASSYARKYALSGLFAIDNTDDADATNDHKEQTNQPKITEEQKAIILALFKSFNATPQKIQNTVYKRSGNTTNDLNELTQDQAARLIKTLNKLKTQGQTA